MGGAGVVVVFVIELSSFLSFTKNNIFLLIVKCIFVTTVVSNVIVVFIIVTGTSCWVRDLQGRTPLHVAAGYYYCCYYLYFCYCFFYYCFYCCCLLHREGSERSL